MSPTCSSVEITKGFWLRLGKACCKHALRSPFVTFDFPIFNQDHNLFQTLTKCCDHSYGLIMKRYCGKTLDTINCE